ncbi:MAG: outer membrane beta-barrel protein [Bacteroides sp.]|nr:outer membrane beta-barrel protein [Bacteroides sp.]
MRKKLVLGIMMSIVSISTFAGGLLTNTNQNAVFLRNPARDAVIAIDGVYSNPAGIAFLPQGFHLGVSWQAAFQKRQMSVDNSKIYPFNANNSNSNRLFEGTAVAPVIPSIQAAYVINDKWSVSAQFAVGGGGGKCEFEEGLLMFEEMIGGQLVGANATSYGLTQSLTGKQYFYGIQLGATYKITDNFSVFGGVRAVLASCAYEGYIKDIKANGVGAASYLGAVKEQVDGGIQQLEPVKDLDDYKERYQTLVGQSAKLGQAIALMGNDFALDCSQSGFGITPIIGVNWNLGKLNLAAKYEFGTKIELENDSKGTSANVTALMPAYADGAKVRSDIPALLTVGAQYSILPSLRVMAGYHQYFDTDAEGSATAVSNNTWEALLGLEWDINDKILISAGAQRTKYGFEDDEILDTSFNISSTALCIGGAYKFSDKVKMNVGYMHSFYEDHDFTNENKSLCSYTRKNDVVGVSLEFKF